MPCPCNVADQGVRSSTALTEAMSAPPCAWTAATKNAGRLAARKRQNQRLKRFGNRTFTLIKDHLLKIEQAEGLEVSVGQRSVLSEKASPGFRRSRVQSLIARPLRNRLKAGLH